MTEKVDHTKYAVENFIPGDELTRLRVMETPQDWTAKAISEAANKEFQRSKRPYKSEWFMIADKNGKSVVRN